MFLENSPRRGKVEGEVESLVNLVKIEDEALKDEVVSILNGLREKISDINIELLKSIRGIYALGRELERVVEIRPYGDGVEIYIDVKRFSKLSLRAKTGALAFTLGHIYQARQEALEEGKEWDYERLLRWDYGSLQKNIEVFNTVDKEWGLGDEAETFLKEVLQMEGWPYKDVRRRPRF